MILIYIRTNSLKRWEVFLGFFNAIASGARTSVPQGWFITFQVSTFVYIIELLAVQIGNNWMKKF